MKGDVKESTKSPTQIQNLPIKSAAIKPASITGTGLISDKNESPSFNKLMNNLNTGNQHQSSYDAIEEINKVLKNQDETQEFNYKMLKATIMNPSIPDENGGGNDEIDNINKITQMISSSQSMRAQIMAQKVMIEAQQNPAMNLFDLKGMKIEYKDNKRHFHKNPVKYNYMVEGDISKNPYITSTLRIVDKKGKEINQYQEHSEIGDNDFEWDGRDSSGKIIDPGEYFLEVEAFSFNTDNKDLKQEQLKAGCLYSGIAESVKIGKGGVAEGLVIDGRIVKRDMLISASEVIRDNTDYISVKSDFVDKIAIMDFSESWVKDNSMTAYYNNNKVSNPLSLTIKIFNEEDLLVKEVEVTKDLVTGCGSVELDDLYLPDGKYHLKTFIKSNENKPMEELSPILERKIYSINSIDNQFDSEYNETFSGRNIKIIKNDFLTPIEKRRDKYLHSTFQYLNNHFNFDEKDTEKVGFVFTTRDEKELIFTRGKMQIFDTKNDDKLIATIDQFYEAEKMLDRDSLEIVQGSIDGLKIIQTKIDDLEAKKILELDSDNSKIIQTEIDDLKINYTESRMGLNNYIENGIKTRGLKLLPGLAEDYRNNLRAINFPPWDGVSNDKTKANQGDRYRRDFVSMHYDQNLKQEIHDVHNEIESSIVKSIDQEFDSLKLNLKNGKTVLENGDIVLEKKAQTNP